MRHHLPEDEWRKSSYSPDNGGNCLETQPAPGEGVAVGDSKDRARGAFVFPADTWASFVKGVKSGDL
ncbi:DUF397 domain-containing protein [Streptomyces alkaliterrae]|nr:DUF397 domain-containing protein [Streptomyces alkaliterrae]